MGYKSNAIRGLSWMTGFRFATRILTFVKTAVLARVLSPSQFGVFGIASLVLVFLEVLIETGINVILIQSKKDIEEFIDSAWVVSIIRGVVICFLIVIASPFIASFFHTPEATGLLLTISLVPLIRGFINPAEVRFQKDLAFGSEFWFRTSIFFFDAAISIITALTTHSVYSLVWGLLAGALLEVLLSFILVKPTPRFIIQKGYFNEIFHKGKWITAYSILNFIAQEGDNIIVGRVMGSGALGIYQMAYKISILPISEVSDVVSKVVFPVYARIGGDRKRLQDAFTKTITLTLLGAAALGVIIYSFPKEIVLILAGDKWLTAVPVLQVLALYGVLRTISGPVSALFLSVGKQNYVTIMTFVRFFGLAATIYPFVLSFGLIGAGYSALLSVIIEIPIILYFLIKVFK
jgi:O-antigen/teichoic acid export membrane protein